MDVSMKLTFRDRLRLTWELTWPLALLDLAAAVLIHGALDAKGESLDLLWAVASFFGIGPWIVRRAFLREKIVAMRNGVESARLSYQQSFKAMWLLTWRTLPLAFAVLLIVSLIFRLTGVSLPSVSAQDPLMNAFGLSVIDALGSLVLYPLLIPGMLKKRYRGFHLEAKARGVT
jgi:hypothetical protein